MIKEFGFTNAQIQEIVDAIRNLPRRSLYYELNLKSSKKNKNKECEVCKENKTNE